MPYLVKKQKDKWCLFKKGANGKPMGKPLGCHDSEDEANKQIAAIHANEGKSTSDMTFKLGKTPQANYLLAEDPDKPTQWADLGKPEADEKKTLNLYELEQKVCYAVTERIRDAAGKEEDDWFWVPVEVFIEFVIVKAKSGLWQIPYTIDAESYEVTLGDPKKVKIEYVDAGVGDEGDSDPNPEDEKYAVIMKARGFAEGEDPSTIKSLGADRVGAYAVLWGDDGRKDLTGQYFDEKTEELSIIYDTVGRLPFLYHHGLDDTLKTTVLGVVDTLKADSIGLWYEAQLKLAEAYDKYVQKFLGNKSAKNGELKREDFEKNIKSLLKNKALKTSTQTFYGALRVNEESGHIERWPIVEITATPTPAEYRMQPVDFLKSAYAEVGCTDFECVIKSKLGLPKAPEVDKGAEEARLRLELEKAYIALLDF